jgi:PA14 domain
VRYSIANSLAPFRLFNVVTDPHEDHDLSGDPTNAALLAHVQDLVKQVRRPDADAPRPYDNDLVPAVVANNLVAGKLNYSVYQGNWPWVPDFDALTPVSSGNAAGLNLAVAAQTNNFGVSYKGYITVPTDGQYTFYLQDDSGAQLWLHEVHLIDDDFNHAGAEVSSTILLKAGLHPIRLFYKHNLGIQNLSLKYSGPNLNKQSIPLTAFAADAE